MSRIDTRAIQLFLTVCREGTISAAARAENLSQPSVSVAISQLERNLNARLFERSRQGIKLTSEGKVLLENAKALENVVNRTQTAIQLTSAGSEGTITVGGTPGALSSLVPPVVRNLQRQDRNFQIHILERPESQLHTLLREYELDIAICTTGINESPKDMVEQPIVSDPFSVIVGAANEHLPSTISLSDLQNSHWVLPDAHGGFRRQIDALFTTNGVPIPRTVIRSDSLLTTKALVRETDYITILPNRVVDAELSSGRLRILQLENINFHRSVGLLWLKERNHSPLLRDFIEKAQMLKDFE